MITLRTSRTGPTELALSVVAAELGACQFAKLAHERVGRLVAGAKTLDIEAAELLANNALREDEKRRLLTRGPLPPCCARVDSGSTGMIVASRRRPPAVRAIACPGCGVPKPARGDRLVETG
jgi:hypothetical protein